MKENKMKEKENRRIKLTKTHVKSTAELTFSMLTVRNFVVYFLFCFIVRSVFARKKRDKKKEKA